MQQIAKMPDWFVYIMSNNARTLYTGMTDDLPKRVQQHKDRTYENAFTARYTFNRLVYYEAAADQKAAAMRERRVKNWPRARRVALINSMNPNWEDLSERFSLRGLLS
ncbi:MAG TPA: GIY-YIG nuclease family protein [Thermoanaerobaculia bacterium]|nr:GIY-YIG nuclease family protein [Thermoanaerobaculia bacterium]